jgi:hypothetical protein
MYAFEKYRIIEGYGFIHLLMIESEAIFFHITVSPRIANI